MNSIKTGGELKCSEIVRSFFLLYYWHPSCYSVKPFISRENEKEGGIAIVTDGTYSWSSCVAHIFHSDLPSNRGDRKTFDVINVTCSLEILGSIASSLVTFFLSSNS